MLDAHQHFWSLARREHAWLTPEYPALNHDFGPEELAPLMQKAGITHTVLVQAAESEEETDYLLEIANRTEFILGVVGWIDMLAEDFPQRLDHYRRQSKWVALRPMLQTRDPAEIALPVFRRSLQLVAQHDVPFDILTFPQHLPWMIDALQATPGVHAIIDHISKPDMKGPLDPGWRASIEALAGMPNVYCKISGLVTEAGPDWTADRIRPFVEFIANAFGPKRLVFGSDWPVCLLAASHAQVVGLAQDILGKLFGPDDLRAIFETNGKNFYRLTKQGAL